MQIQEITLNSPNPEKQAEFYAEFFDLNPEQAGDKFNIQIGRSRLSFQAGDFPARAHYAFDIPENQFLEAATWLKARLPLLRDDRGDWHFSSDNWNADMLYFYDADENVVEFIARHNQPTASTEPFTAKSLVSISEIGLITPHVIETVAILKQRLGLKAWRGAGSESFTAVGDENGLFMVAVEGRAWRPEQIGAKPTPIHVKLAGLEKTYRFPNLPYLIEGNEEAAEI